VKKHRLAAEVVYCSAQFSLFSVQNTEYVIGMQAHEEKPQLSFESVRKCFNRKSSSRKLFLSSVLKLQAKAYECNAEGLKQE